MFHDIFHGALENIAQLVNGIDFHIFILAQSVNLGSVHIMVGVQVILREPLGFHGFPKSIIFYHNNTLFFLAFSLLLP